MVTGLVRCADCEKVVSLSVRVCFRKCTNIKQLYCGQNSGIGVLVDGLSYTRVQPVLEVVQTKV